MTFVTYIKEKNYDFHGRQKTLMTLWDIKKNLDDFYGRLKKKILKLHVGTTIIFFFRTRLNSVLERI